MKEKNKEATSIGFWSFIFVIAIGFGYLNDYVWHNSAVNHIFTGGKVIAFFLFLTGYFLVKYYKNNKHKNENSANLAWNYFFEKFRKLYPVLLSGVLVAFIVRNIIAGTKINNIFAIFMNSIWEFLGLSQLGAVNFINIDSLTFTPAVGVSYLWNYPLWIISAILIVSLILYYILSKNEDLFKGLIAPVIIIITYSNIGFGSAGLDINLLNSFGIANGLARVLAAVCLGMLMYYIVEYFKKKKFNEFMMMLFSLLHIGIAIFLLYTIYVGISWSELVNGIILYIFCIVLLVNKDYISVLYSNSYICKLLGKMSLYYYAYFIVFVYLIAYIFPEMSYYASLVFNFLFSTGFAFIMMCLMEYVIFPIIKKSKNNC